MSTLRLGLLACFVVADDLVLWALWHPYLLTDITNLERIQLMNLTCNMLHS